MAISVAGGLKARELLLLLGDGRLHCCQRLMRGLHLDRRELEESVAQAREWGAEVEGLARGGYRLAKPVEWLDAGRIRAALGAETEGGLHNLEVLFETASTNTRLLELPPPPAGRVDACLSELQHAGRGRRGRRWLAPFGDCIALSIGWALAERASPDPCLSLAAGVAVCRALTRVGARAVGLKWPNDIWLSDRKLGGILLEARGEGSAAARAVVGVGLNVSLSGAVRQQFEQVGLRAAAVADACAQTVSRNRLAAALLDELLSMLRVFERQGFEPFRAEWTALDALRDLPVRLLAGDSVLEGTARGVDEAGRLRLESAGRIHSVMSGEVSVRLTEGVC